MVCGLGFGVWGLGFGVWGLGFRFKGFCDCSVCIVQLTPCAQFQHDRALPQFSRQIDEAQAAITALGIEGSASEEIGALFEMQDGLAALHREVQRACTLPAHCLPFLQPGRCGMRPQTINPKP